MSKNSTRTSVSAPLRRVIEKTHVETELPIAIVTTTAESGQSVDTHALLDTGGDRTFCFSCLDCKKIKVKRQVYRVNAE